MTELTEDAVRAMRARADAATKGAWFTVGSTWLPPNCNTYVIAGCEDPHGGNLVCNFDFIEDRNQDDNSDADAEFIAAARTDLPALADSWLAQHAEIEAISKTLSVISEDRIKVIAERDDLMRRLEAAEKALKDINGPYGISIQA